MSKALTQDVAIKIKAAAEEVLREAKIHNLQLHSLKLTAAPAAAAQLDFKCTKQPDGTWHCGPGGAAGDF
jgi:hypothetical protein